MISRQRPPRNWYFVLNAPSANAVNKFPSNVRSISSWEVTKNVRDKWSSFKKPCRFNCPIHPEKRKLHYVLYDVLSVASLKRPDKDVEPLDTYEVIKSIALLFREEQPKISCLFHLISKFIAKVWVFLRSHFFKN